MDALLLLKIDYIRESVKFEIMQRLRRFAAPHNSYASLTEEAKLWHKLSSANKQRTN